MTLLQPVLHVEGGPDPGTRPWELQNALGGGKISGATYGKGNKRESAICNKTDDSSQNRDGSCYLDSEIDDEGAETCSPELKMLFTGRMLIDDNMVTMIWSPVLQFKQYNESQYIYQIKR
ncbi:hypothetical protein ACHAXR_012873 [Thalassiosira sp. AJA248-18]